MTCVTHVEMWSCELAEHLLAAALFPLCLLFHSPFHSEVIQSASLFTTRTSSHADVEASGVAGH